jgi:acyl carrier protein
MELIGFREDTYGIGIDDSQLLIENLRWVTAIGSLIERQRDDA